MRVKSVTLTLCNGLLAEGKLGEAVQLVQLSQQEPGAAQRLSFTELAEVLLNTGAIDQGLDDPVLAENPHASTALAEIGKVFYKSGRFPEAVRVLQQAKRLDDTSTAVRETLSRSLNACGDRAGARREAYDLQPIMASSKNDLIRLQKLYRDLNLKEMAELASVKLLAIEPSSFEIRRSLISLLMDMKETNKVRAQLAIFKASAGLGRDDLLFAARGYLWLATYANAEASNLPSPTTSATSPRFLQPDAYFKSNPRADNEAAAMLAEQAAAAGGIDFPLKLIAVQASASSKTTRQLRRDTRSLIELAKTAEQYADVADLWVKFGRPVEAAEAARRAIEVDRLNSKIPLVRLRLANILSDLGRQENARECLRPIDVTSVQGGSVLRQYHEACFKARLDEAALASAKVLLTAEPDNVSFKNRVALLSMVNHVVAPRRETAHTTTDWFRRFFHINGKRP